MSKLLKLRRLSTKRLIILCLLLVFILVFIFHPFLNVKRTFEYIDKSLIYQNLNQATSTKYYNNASTDCEYDDIIFKDTTMSTNVIEEDLVRVYNVKEGGEFSPDCKPKFSTAVIVPYRDRPEQLREFVVYMHTYLQRQNIHYRIYVIEQLDSNPFNRAKLLNVGAKVAMDAGYPCLVLHDVDLLPLKLSNLYACSKQPRHMSTIINTFRFVLPYLNMFGGVIAIISNQYKNINGMSNQFYGWGGEDDDLYLRLEQKGYKICRFDPDMTIYHMQKHKKAGRKGQNIIQLLNSSKERMENDGLNTLTYTYIGTVLHPLFTHIMVDI